MAEVEVPQESTPVKKSKRIWILAVLLALGLAGGGFYATYSGLVFGGHEADAAAEPEADDLPDIAFVPVEQLLISLGPAASNGHLRLSANLEVAKVHEPEVLLLMPRILDVMNGYLRAVDIAEIEDPTALVRLRAHLLRRIQIVAGEGRVRDLLITEFVLN